MNLFLVFISLFPVFLIGMYIYMKDKNKEPIKILVRLFIYGILSCFLTIFLTYVLSMFFPILLEDTTNLNYIELFFYVFIGIALIEEASKWIMVYFISYKSKSFDEVYDMIVYSVFVALGFAAFENLLYVFDGGIVTGLLRTITAIPGHACDAVVMGYFLSQSKISLLRNDKGSYKKYLFLSVLIPTILHGIYDYCLFSGNLFLLLFFVIFLIFMYIFVIILIKRLSKTVNLFYKNNFCGNCGNSIKDGNFCGNCGKRISE